jgi:hypothetical protein
VPCASVGRTARHDLGRVGFYRPVDTRDGRAHVGARRRSGRRAGSGRIERVGERGLRTRATSSSVERVVFGHGVFIIVRPRAGEGWSEDQLFRFDGLRTCRPPQGRRGGQLCCAAGLTSRCVCRLVYTRRHETGRRADHLRIIVERVKTHGGQYRRRRLERITHGGIKVKV